MERLILPIFALFGFFGSLFMDAGETSVGRVTHTSKATFGGDS